MNPDQPRVFVLGFAPDDLPRPARLAAQLVLRRDSAGRVTADAFPEEIDVDEHLVSRLDPALVRLERERLYIEVANGRAVYILVGPSPWRCCWHYCRLYARLDD